MKKEYFSPEIEVDKFDLTVFTDTASGLIEGGDNDVTLPGGMRTYNMGEF